MRISRTLQLSFLFLFSFFFLLMYAGMSIVILGLLANELALIIFGVIWEIVTIFIFRNAFPFKMLIGALAGALFGGVGGALLGMFVGHMGDLVVGVVGGAIFGALSGIVIFGIVSHALPFGWIPIVGPLVDHLLRREGLGLPPVVSGVLSVGAMIIGAIWGINVAREVYPKIFGPIGGLATVGWIVGMIVGAFVSARMFHSTEYKYINHERRSTMSKRKQNNPNKERAKAVMFSDNLKTAEVVREEGVEVYGVIKTCQEEPDPHDREHRIFILEYEYEVDSRLFKRELKFSINVDHIVYGECGMLFNTPKFKYGLDDFRNSMQPGQKLKIRTLKKPPYWFWVEANEVMAEVMRHDVVWS